MFQGSVADIGTCVPFSNTLRSVVSYMYPLGTAAWKAVEKWLSPRANSALQKAQGMSPVTRDLIEVGFEAEKSSDLY